MSPAPRSYLPDLSNEGDGLKNLADRCARARGPELLVLLSLSRVLLVLARVFVAVDSVGLFCGGTVYRNWICSRTRVYWR